MNIKFLSVIALVGLLLVPETHAARYGEKYCNQSGYHCIRVKGGQTWSSLFSNAKERDVVKRLNRMNVRLRSGMRIAVPDRLSSTSVWDISPFASRIKAPGRKTIIINQRALAWGAYNASGELIWWGPISSGQNYCRDVGRGCKTISGVFTMYSKRGPGCISSKYPVGRGGAKMPYCMFFHRGYALHGSYTVPGYRASHGCIRLFNEDARWLNKDFIHLPGSGRSGTRVIVRPL